MLGRLELILGKIHFGYSAIRILGILLVTSLRPAGHTGSFE